MSKLLTLPHGQKMAYLSPTVEVLSIASIQETMQSASVLSIVGVAGADLSTPSEIAGTWDSLFE